MTPAARQPCDPSTILAAALAGTRTEAHSAALPALGPEAVVAFAMAVAAHMAARAAAAACNGATAPAPGWPVAGRGSRPPGRVA